MASIGTQIDASEVLAAALEQMDGIIAGTKLGFQNGLNNNQSSAAYSSKCESSAGVDELLRQLKDVVVADNDSNDNVAEVQQIDPELANFLFIWLQNVTSKDERQKAPIQSGGGSYDELQDRLHRLHGEKENLMLQVSVLSEQVEAQVEKMRELESVLEEKRGQLDSTEELCRLEMLSRSGLMGEVEHLRARLSSVEQDKKDLVERLKKLQAENAVACEKTNERENELLALKSVLARNGTISAVTDYITEIEKLKKRLDELVASNEEKDKTIEELALVVSRQKRIQEWIPSERRVSDPPPLPERTNENTSSPQPSDSSKVLEKPPPVPRTSLPSCSTPLSSPPGWSENRSSPSLSQISLRSFQKSGSAENIVTPSNASTGSRTPPAKRHYSTLPRPHGAQVLQQIQQQLQQHHRAAEPSPDGAIVHSTNINTSPSHSYHSLHNSSLDAFRSTRSNKPPAVSFGKVLFGLKTGKRSTSAPQLAAQPEIVPLPLENDSNTLPHDSMSSQKDKNKGIKKIWGKLRRSGSHTMDLKQAEFKRGGIRATAGPRLGWSQEAKNETHGVPVSQWNNEKIIDWLNKMGLGVYVGECKKWGKGGSHLHKASARDLEEWLGMKNPLHRKKVLLALQAAGDSLKGDSLGMAASRLDHHWVVRWLDDVGLPQYKDAFLDARVDGNLLHFLTVEDLIALKVTNLLHHISIKQGIQVLRQKRFDPFCLKRRSIPDETTSYAPADVVLWTNHRVMEWLRTVDLSEYAPNLRGSGVHGALIAYEPRFNAELMASLLNIPPNKTLLRRHLSTQFKQLVGTDLMMEKRDCQTQATFVPLTPNTKVKAVHRGQFSLIKKRVKGEVELEEFVCSMDPPPQLPLPNHRNAEKTAEEIGTVSKDISQLADKLQNEQLLATMAATNV